MCQRVGYAIKMGWHFRKELRKYKHASHLQAPTLFSLNLKNLKTSGIKVLVLDFDGVLAPHGEETLSSTMQTWLKSCFDYWPATSIFILTNRPTAARAHFFSTHFPGIQYVQTTRKKPYPEGLLAIAEKAQVSPKEMFVVDDRLLTGILAAIIVGAEAGWITKPLVSFKKRPFTELFFCLLRSVESLLLF